MPIYRSGRKTGVRTSGCRSWRGRPWTGSRRFCRSRKPVGEHHDPLQVAIPLAGQQGAGSQLGSGLVEISHEPVDPVRRSRPDPVEQAPTVGIQFAEPIGLQPISQDTKQQVAGQVTGCSASEHRVPSGSQFPDIETAQTRDLVVEQVSIWHRRIDHHACHGALKPRDGASHGTQNVHRPCGRCDRPGQRRIAPSADQGRASCAPPLRRSRGPSAAANGSRA